MLQVAQTTVLYNKMDGKGRLNNTSRYICVPQYDHGSFPLEVCGEMLYGAIPKKCDRGRRDEVDDVISRLNDYNEKRLAYYVCAVCTCRTSGLSNTIKRQPEDTQNSNGEESDNEGLEVQQLVDILHKHRYKTDTSHANKALARLVTSFTGRGVTDSQLNQMQDLLNTDKPSLQSATLTFVYQLCLYEETAKQITQHSILMEILGILSAPHDVTVQIAAFKTLEKLYSYKSLSESLCHHVEVCLLPAVLRTYYNSGPLAVKYSATCLLRSLSMHKATSEHLGQELLIILKQFKDSSAKLKEVFTEIIVNLYKLQGLVDTKLLDTNLLPSCSDLISDGPCSSQVAALSMLTSLLEEEKYITVTIKHRYLIPSILNCLQLSDCRKVREASSCMLKCVTKSQNSKIATEFMKQTALYFNTDDSGEPVADTRLVYPVLLKHQTEEKLWDSMEQLTILIVNSIFKEAELSKDESNDITKAWNCSQHQLGCLVHLSHVLHNLCVWPIEKEKTYLPKLDIDDLCEDEEMRSVVSRINRQLTLDVWYKCGSQIMTILRNFSRRLQTGLELTNAETVPDRVPLVNDSCPLTDREYELVLNILDVLSFISVATCHRNNGRTTKVDKSTSEKQLWIDDNPHLTGSIDRVSAVVKPEEALKDQHAQEAVNQTRMIRRGLYEQNLYVVLSPFLESKNTRIRVLSSLILRCSVQPLDDTLQQDITPQPPLKHKRNKPRPLSAITRSNNHKIDLTLHSMSPHLASSVKKSLGPRPASAKYRTNTETMKPLTQQCRQSAVRACGPRLLKGIFSKSRDVKKSCLLLIQDLVKYGTVETHMELSQLGCIPKLIDFLRINEDDEMLEITGLILTRMLISSDMRLKQLFNRHGGARVLMAMAQYTKGKLRDEVRSTLQEVTRGEEKSRRPVSAPTVRTPAPDVWDHIMGRWQQEDEVVHVLRQWLTDEKGNKKKTY